MRTTLMAFILVSSAIPASARDNLIGDWSTDCGEKFQCMIEITKAGKVYEYRWTQADRMNFDKKFCVAEGTLTKQASGSFVGKFEKNGHIQIDNFDDSIAISQTPNEGCGKLGLNGVYFPIGD